MNTRPNIIYIMADDMGFGDPGCYGADLIPTPNMDRIASQGTRFTDAHSSSAVCTPSRYGVLTGRYCWRTIRKRGVGGGFSLPLIDPSRTTVASLLKSSGYATGAVGKWHVGLEWQLKEKKTPPSPYKDIHSLHDMPWEDIGIVDYTRPFLGGPTSLGFDYFFGIAGSLDMPPYAFLENDRTVGLPTVEKDPYNAQQKKGFMTPGWRDEEVDTTFAEKAVQWIEDQHRANRDQPFFLYLTPSAPHRPCMPPARFRGASRAGPRGDMVHVVDWMVGEIDDKLEQLGLRDNTLLIVTSDNGARSCDVDGNTYGHKSCGELRGFKTDIWEGGHREPFIARWPNVVQPGSECNDPLCLTDLMATCADITGQALPYNAGEDSSSFLKALKGEENRDRRRAVVHHSSRGVFAVREENWKAIFSLGSGGSSKPRDPDPVPEGPRGQLYDMSEDWRETDNLWLDKPDVVERLTSVMTRSYESERTR
jgi:arylsulfatase A-like enzyme